ncbi:MAG TPA: LssY C-terminal domain-containing protein [Terriglobales bacterium]
MRLVRSTLILLILIAVPQAFACSQIPSGTIFEVRLVQPVSSYNAKKGATVRGIVLESPYCNGDPILPINTPVVGTVIAVHRVGLGLVHETASLQIEFSQIMPAGNPALPIHGEVQLVENARETTKKGVIHGIRGTETPQGEISSRLKNLPSWNLYPDPFLMGFKLLFPIFPEPEIYLPAGTDFRVVLKDDVPLPEGYVEPEPLPTLNSDESRMLSVTLNELPARTLDKNSREADIIDVAFVGSRELLEQSFTAARWKHSDTLSRHTVLHQFDSFLTNSNYSTAPMSRQTLNGRTPDLMLEKGLDSYEKRDHVRIWAVNSEPQEGPVWVGAAVRETGASLSVKQKGFMHHVSPDLDEEREVILRDFDAAGCVASAGLVEKTDARHAVINATREVLRTDGNVLVIALKPCDTSREVKDSPRFRPGSRFTRFVRKEILIVRSDLLRANVIYAAFDLAMISVKAEHRTAAERAALRSVDLTSESSAAVQIPAVHAANRP